MSRSPTSSASTPPFAPHRQLHNDRPSHDRSSYHPFAHRHHDYPSRPRSALLRVGGPAFTFPPHHNIDSESRRASQTYSLPPTHGLEPAWIFTPAPSLTRSAPYQTSSSEEWGAPPSSLQINSRDQTWNEKPPSRSSSLASKHHNYSTYSDSEDEPDGDNSGPTFHQTVRSLSHLALTVAPLSIVLLLYTLLALIYSITIAPLRLCIKSRPSLSTQISRLLIPPLNLQRRCIFAPQVGTTEPRSSISQTPLSSNEAPDGTAADWSHVSPGSLLATHLLAPIVVLPLTVCAWIMGVAWALGAIVSDESAGDVRDERRFAEKVVGWWSTWLNHRVRPKEHEGTERHRRAREMSATNGAVELVV